MQKLIKHLEDDTADFFHSALNKIVVFGAGHLGDIAYRFCQAIGVPVQAYVDNFKLGHKNHIQIYDFKTFEKTFGSNTRIIIAVAEFEDEIEAQLASSGYHKIFRFSSWRNKHKLTLQEFIALIENLDETGHFSFGYNWIDYVKNTLSHSIIEEHEKDLRQIYKESNVNIRGMSAIDIGCGSGLSSLALKRLGVGSLHSIDNDPHSISATRITRETFGEDLKNWTIEQQDILEWNGRSFDLVYSWGVLHHTGNMWQAIRIASQIVNPGGILHLALYTAGPKYSEHLSQKQHFSSLNRSEKIMYLYDFLRPDPTMFLMDKRGMNKYHDAMDWLGGLPYEVCEPTQLTKFLNGFKRIFYSEGTEGGNFVTLFIRQ